jgi:uncharacterized protein YecE (DUF72 family)
MSALIRLGCQGWTYPDWVGTFYPPGAKQETLLPFYASVFDTVELDNTFYRAPRPSVARSWARHTPAHFRFSAKVPRALTHEAGLRGVAAALADFARALEPLGEKLGPLLVQLPAEFTRDEDTFAALAQFLAAAPAGLRLAVEFRHRSWHEARTVDLLRERGASLAWTEWRELPRFCEATAPFLYLRWLGDRRAIERYDRVQVDRTAEFVSWEEEVRRAAGVVDEIYGYYNNHWAGHSPASVNEFKRRLGMPVIEPQEMWPQRQLW